MMVKRLLTSLLCIGLAAVSASAQDLPQEPLAELFAGRPGSDIILAMAENHRGELAAAGRAARGENGGTDVFLVLTDKDLAIRSQRYIGRSADDGAHHIAAGLDGRWLLAGYSERPNGADRARERYFGKRDAWFVLLDENGRVNREFVFGTPADDEFRHVSPLPDGGFLLVGHSGGHAWLLRLDAEGRIVWEKKYQHHSLPTQALAATVTPDGQVFTTGYVTEGKKQRLWLAGFTLDGGSIFEKTFPASQAGVGNSIIELNQETLLVAGHYIDKKLRENAFVCKTDKAGTLIECRSYGGREADRVSAATLLHNGNLVLAGSSKSFERGSRRFRAWVCLVTPEGELKAERYYGSKLDDGAQTVLQRHDGRMVVGGFSGQSVLQTEQAWVVQLTKPSRVRPPAAPLSVSVLPVWYPNGQFGLPGDRIFVPLQIESQEDGGLVGLRAVLTPEGDFSQARQPDELLLPPLPPKSRRIAGLLLPSPDAGWPAVQSFKIELFQGERVVSLPAQVTMKFGEAQVPDLQLSARLDGSAVEVSLLNKGLGRAQGVTLFLSGLPSTQGSGQIFIGDLPSGESARRSIPIDLKQTGPEVLRIRAVDASLLFSDTLALELQSAEVTVNVGTDTLQRSNFLTAVWMNPNPDQFDHRDIVWPEEEITITVKVVSNRPIEKQHLCIQINGKPCTEGAKFEEVQMRGSRFSRTFQQRVRLTEGANTIQAVVNNEAGTSQLDALSVVYAPRSPNLHLLSIGVPSADLRYTTSDARDFAEAMVKGNKAFSACFTDTLYAENNATKTEILKSLRRLQYRFADRQIARQDLLIVFVSSHGIHSEGRFRIAAADYDGPFLQETSLDFEHEVIRYLQTIECRQLFVIDACHSGSADLPIRASGSGLADLAASKQGLNLLASCRNDEYSYEDEAWRNGAFTEAIVQALAVFRDNPNQLDTNQDGQLDIQELYRFLELRIPALVQTKRPKTPTNQTPLLITTPATQPIILFKK